MLRYVGRDAFLSGRRVRRGRVRRDWRVTPLEDRVLLTVTDVMTGMTFSTITAAVAAATSGTTLEVGPGTYAEQVTIDKSLTLQGTGPGVIIAPPSTPLVVDLGQASLVEIGGGATVNIDNLTIEGPDPRPATSPVLTGIYVVGGATANVTGVTIDKMRQEPLGGLQSGRGILVGSTGQSQVGHATITDCTIMDYQKSGIVTGGNGTTLTVTGTTITGVGPTSVVAQNGININPGTTATITNNTITGNQFTGANSGPDPTAVQSGAILNFGSGSSIAGNTVTGNDFGISDSSTGTTISGNTVQGNRFEGIVLNQGTATVSNNTITGNNIGVAVIAVAGNTADSQGTLVSNNIFDNGNGGLSFPGGGIRLLVQTGATTTALATANFNRIVGNSIGLDNTTSNPVTATENWWGGNAGPNQTGNETTSLNNSVVFSPWLVLGISTVPTPIGPGGTSAVTADLTTDSSGATHSTAPFFPNGIPIAFSATGGTITPASVPTLSGKASSSFTSTTPGDATASATLDNQTVTTPTPVVAITFPPPQSPPATADAPFSQTFVASGGAGDFTYAVSPTGSQLPPGLTLDSSTGLLSGTPTTPGTYTSTVTATDRSGASASLSSTILVNQALAINPTTPPQGTVGASYSEQLSTSGGTAPVTFALSGGTALPPGLVLSPAGLISGTPTAAGTFPFTVTATDGNGAAASLGLSIVVTPASQVVAPTVVNLQRFGFHAQPTTYVLTFSTALDPAPAQDVQNYTLAPIGPRGHLGREIRIVSAIYDPLTLTVTIHPATRVYLFQRYRLVVNGSTPTGVAGATGLLLDGRGNGMPGTDYVANFGKEILAGPTDLPRVSRRSLHVRQLPTTTHASSHQPTGSTAASRNQALSAAAVDAVLAAVVGPKKHES